MVPPRITAHSFLKCSNPEKNHPAVFEPFHTHYFPLSSQLISKFTSFGFFSSFSSRVTSFISSTDLDRKASQSGRRFWICFLVLSSWLSMSPYYSHQAIMRSCNSFSQGSRSLLRSLMAFLAILCNSSLGLVPEFRLEVISCWRFYTMSFTCHFLQNLLNAFQILCRSEYPLNASVVVVFRRGENWKPVSYVRSIGRFADDK